jgi:hypothetical protein
VAVSLRYLTRSGCRGLHRSVPLFSPNPARRFHSLYAGGLTPLDRGADEGYLAVARAAWEADKDPVNADLLTKLVLATFSLCGLSLGWLLTNSQRQGALCFLGIVGPSLASACEGTPFLGVFRL